MHKKPHIKTKLPGPKASKVIKRDHKVMSPSYTRAYPLVADLGRGIWIVDPDGNVFMDFSCGIAVTATGHSHPSVVAAIKKQADRLLHMSGTDFYYEVQVDLAEKLAKLAPGKSEKKVFFCNSGTEAVEAAFKLARYKSHRERMIAFLGAFHGRTFGSLSLTGSKIKQRENFGELVPGVHHVPFGYCYRCPYNLTYPTCDVHCVKVIEEEYFRTVIPPEEVAALIVEPIQGEGGYVMPPPAYHQRLRELTQKYNILMIMDEVQTGFGRTGKMFAIEHWGVEPDIIAIAKGIASGLPLGGIIAKSSIMKWEPGSHASTFGGNPVSCAAALASLKLIREKLLANVKKLGPYLGERLKNLQNRFEIIGDVRGVGFMWGLELVKDRITKEKAIAERDKIVQLAFKRGLLILGAGQNTIRLIPPLIITKQEIDTAIDILEECFEELEQKGKTI